MRRITVQARQLQPGDQFSSDHHELYTGTVVEIDRVRAGIRITTHDGDWSGHHTLDQNHPVTVLRA